MLQNIKSGITHHGVQVGLHAGVDGEVVFFFPDRKKSGLNDLFGLIPVVYKAVGVVAQRLVIGFKNHLKSSYIPRLQRY